MKKIYVLACSAFAVLTATGATIQPGGGTSSGTTAFTIATPQGISTVATNLQQALDTAGANSAVWLKAGTFNIGSNTIVPAQNQTIYAWGATIYGTNCTASASALGNISMMIKPVNGLKVYGGIWTNSPDSGTYSSYVGNRTNDSATATNVLFEGCTFMGADTDGVYLANTNAAQTITFRSCFIETRWDTVVLKSTVYTNRHVMIEECVLVATNLSTVTPNDHKGVNVEGGYVTIKNSLIDLTNGTLSNVGIKVAGAANESSQGYIKAYNVGFRVTGTAPYEAENGADYIDAGISDPTNIVMVGCYRLAGGALRLNFPGADGSAGATIWRPIYGNYTVEGITVGGTLNVTGASTFTGGATAGSLTVSGVLFGTNLFSGALLPVNTNYNLTTSANLGFTGLGGTINSTSYNYGELMVLASGGNVVITNIRALSFSDGLTNRTLTNGDSAEISIKVTPGVKTNCFYAITHMP